MFEVTMLFILLRRRIGDVDAPRLARSTARIVVAASVMAIVLVPFTNHFASSPSFVAIVGTLIGAVVYLIVTLALRSDEIAFVARRVKIINRKSEIIN
jgi:hypothetical protein